MIYHKRGTETMAGCSDPSQVKVFKLIDGDRVVVSDEEAETAVDIALGANPADIVIVQTDDEAEILKHLKIAEAEILKQMDIGVGGDIRMPKENSENEEGEGGDISPGD